MEEIVREILFDDVAFVATADNKVIHAVVRVHLHDVPEDRTAADLDHRLGLEVSFF